MEKDLTSVFLPTSLQVQLTKIHFWLNHKNSEKEGSREIHEFATFSHQMTLRWWLLTAFHESDIWAHRFCLTPNPHSLLLFATHWASSKHQPGWGRWQWKDLTKEILNKTWCHQDISDAPECGRRITRNPGLEWEWKFHVAEFSFGIKRRPLGLLSFHKW